MDRLIWRCEASLREFATQIGATENPSKEDVLGFLDTLDKISTDRKVLQARLEAIK